MVHTMNATQRAMRILKPMPRFRAGFKNGLPSYASEIPLGPFKDLIGIYENSDSSKNRCVVVTEAGLLVEKDGTWEAHSYSEIDSVGFPLKTQLSQGNVGITIQKSNQSLTLIPIVGSQGKFFDVFEFGRFLMRVVEDQKRNDQTQRTSLTNE